MTTAQVEILMALCNAQRRFNARQQDDGNVTCPSLGNGCLGKTTLSPSGYLRVVHEPPDFPYFCK